MGVFRRGLELAIASFTVGLVGMGPVLLEARASESPDLTPHPAILIDGDEDFCDDEDRDGSVGQDDGIVNCGAADGTPERPYVIAGWDIRLLDQSACVEPPPPGLAACGPPPECPSIAPHEDAVYGGAINLCRTTKHVLLRDLQVYVGGPFLILGGEGDPTGPCEAAGGCSHFVIGVAVSGSSNVTLDALHITTGSIGIRAAQVNDQAGHAWAASNLRFDNLRLDALLPQYVPPLDARLLKTVELLNADAVIARSTVDAAGHLVGISSRSTSDLERGVVHRLVLRDSIVQNALQNGINVLDAEAELRGNVFQSNGLERARVPNVDEILTINAGDVVLTGLASPLPLRRFDVTENTFRLHSATNFGLMIETNGIGSVELNRFEGLPNLGVAIHQRTPFQCNAAIRYNDFNQSRVVNDEEACTVQAPRNWWGSEGGPASSTYQVEGRIASPDWLKHPLEDLPTVSVLSPTSGRTAFGKIVVRGTAAPSADRPLARVEATRTADDWSRAVVAVGLETWALRVDLASEALGPLALWFRACDASDCGVPDRLDLTVVDKPRPPVAVLASSQDSPHVGDPTTLDASASYSPQGSPIVEYGFSLGDGTATQWRPTPTLQATYVRSGQFSAQVEVRDSEGLQSTNLAQVLLRVVDPAAGLLDPRDSGGAIPGFAPWVVLAGLAGAAGAFQRRSR